jgi:hypothetical protein
MQKYAIIAQFIVKTNKSNYYVVLTLYLVNKGGIVSGVNMHKLHIGFIYMKR